MATPPTTVTAAPRQLSDGNSQGTILGQTLNSLGLPDKISFFGATPVTQPAGAAEASVTQGKSAGVIAIYNTTQSPTAVTLNTSVESTFTVQTGTGFTMQPATGDVFYVNKPTSQAGLGVGNVRVSAANTVRVNFNNVTGSTVTPTGSEVYGLVGIRGLPSQTVTLSPAAVPATTIAEQLFTVSGLTIPVGSLVQVSKPTSQTGLDVVGCRVAAANQLGITFLNATASPITPTAAESYTVQWLLGVDAVNNDVFYGFNVGTVGAITAGVVVSGGSTALTGLLASDMITGIFKPTPQAGATNVATPIYAIPTANTLTLYFLGTGTGATPTPSEVYGIRTARLAPAAPLVIYTQSLAPVSVAATTSAEQTFTVTGLVAGTAVWVNKPSPTSGLAVAGVRVSAVNTLAINYVNVTASAIVPPTEVYTIGNFQLPLPGAGNVAYQTALPSEFGSETLSNTLRAAMVSLGLIAGA